MIRNAYLAKLISGQEGSDGEALEKGTIPTDHGEPDDKVDLHKCSSS